MALSGLPGLFTCGMTLFAHAFSPFISDLSRGTRGSGLGLSSTSLLGSSLGLGFTVNSGLPGLFTCGMTLFAHAFSPFISDLSRYTRGSGLGLSPTSLLGSNLGLGLSQ